MRMPVEEAVALSKAIKDALAVYTDKSRKAYAASDRVSHLEEIVRAIETLMRSDLGPKTATSARVYNFDFEDLCECAIADLADAQVQRTHAGHAYKNARQTWSTLHYSCPCDVLRDDPLNHQAVCLVCNRKFNTLGLPLRGYRLARTGEVDDWAEAFGVDPLMLLVKAERNP